MFLSSTYSTWYHPGSERGITLNLFLDSFSEFNTSSSGILIFKEFGVHIKINYTELQRYIDCEDILQDIQQLKSNKKSLQVVKYAFLSEKIVLETRKFDCFRS